MPQPTMPRAVSSMPKEKTLLRLADNAHRTALQLSKVIKAKRERCASSSFLPFLSVPNMASCWHTQRETKNFFLFFFPFLTFEWREADGRTHARTLTRLNIVFFFIILSFRAKSAKPSFPTSSELPFVLLLNPFLFFFIHSTISYNYLVGCCTWSSS